MLINVEENLLDQSRSSTLIDNEIENFLETNEGQNIKADIDLLNEMGFDKKMINKVYILLRPANIERAIDYMSEIDGIYQHDFLESTKPNEKDLCFICKKPKQNHLDYIDDDLLNENQNNNQNNHEQDIINKEDNNIIKDDIAEGECELCYEEIYKKDKEKNTIPCGHLYCNHCWFNYLKTLIMESRVDNIKCMNQYCYDYISEEFVLNHISEDKNLIEKYKRFKKRVEIFKDPNKKLCPNPDCESFLQKSELTKYVECEFGHKYCFECLKPPHGNKSCDKNIDTKFMKWKEGKRVKKCPRCQIFTEKNEGCNHMTCVNCKYQWCWLCEGPYKYGHYDSGKCAGHQFTRADNLDEIPKRNNSYNHYDNLFLERRADYFGLHSIFPCYFDPIPDYGGPNIMEEQFFIRYLIMLLIWIFGVIIVFCVRAFDYVEENISFKSEGGFFENLEFVIIGLTGLCLLICYQILFTCLLSPFMLISFFYHKFFDKIQLFFELY